MKPFFTIVTPSYNYGRFIEDCILSVREQAGVSFEHLVFDAGSSDNTHEMLENYPHLKTTIEPDEGMSDAINKGFRAASGEWVMWLNADDRLKPGALREMANFIKNHADSDVVFGTCDLVDVSGALIKRMRLLPFVPFINAHHNCYIPSTATFFNVDRVIRKGFELDLRFPTAMDKEFYARLGDEKMRFRYFPCVLAEFRIHDGNLSQIGKVAEQGSLDAELENARTAIEGVSIRRTYGFTPFRKSIYNAPIDFLLYMVAWGIKGVLKLPFYFKVREPRVEETASLEKSP